MSHASRLAVAVLAALVSLAHAGNEALDSMVAAERAFARASVESGMKSAFLGVMADDAILFRPGPVNGVQAWRTRPDATAVLEWAPAYGEVSGDGDLGFSTGPWTLRPAAGQDAVAFGHFVSVWRREPGGPWRLVLDIGISHPDPGLALADVELKVGPVHLQPDTNAWRGSNLEMGVGVRTGNVGVGVGTGGSGVAVGGGGFGVGVGSYTGTWRTRRDYLWQRNAHEKHTLMSAERTFSFNARKYGWDETYRRSASNDLRHYREGAAPGLGHEVAIEAAAGVPVTREWITRGQAVATSWDLGYTYGLAVAKPGPKSPKGARPDTASFVHLWRKDDAGAWRMMLDIESPFPKPDPQAKQPK